MIIRVLAAAEREIQKAAQRYEQQVTGLGTQFLAAVSDGLLKIERGPERYTAPPKYRGKRNIRRVLLARFPYLVVYEIRPADLLVIAAPHAKR